MLESVRIARRQSEIRQALAGLVGNTQPSEDEVRNIEALDLEFRQNETRYRAALICEDTERREAGAELETRSGAQWAELMAGFELRQRREPVDPVKAPEIGRARAEPENARNRRRADDPGARPPRDHAVERAACRAVLVRRSHLRARPGGGGGSGIGPGGGLVLRQFLVFHDLSRPRADMRQGSACRKAGGASTFLRRAAPCLGRGRMGWR